MVRQVVKGALASALHASGALRAASAISGRRRLPLIVAYHRVVTDFDANARRNLPAMLISLPTLERHLEWIGRRYAFASLDELADRLENPVRGGKPLAAVTFDDGYRDTYLQALPLLERMGIPGAVFVVADLVGTSRLQRHDALHLVLDRALAAWRNHATPLAFALRRHGASHAFAQTAVRTARTAPYLTPLILEGMPAAQVDALIGALTEEFGDVAAGREELLALDWSMLASMVWRGMTVGSHTATHPALTIEDPAVAHREARASRATLESRLGIPIRHFAYPGGRFDANAVEAVAAAGYRLAYTTCFHRDDGHPELTVPRRVFWETTARGSWGEFSSAMMSCQVHGAFDFGAECRHVREPVSFESGAAGIFRAVRGAR
jgi:peptidoglycan/xylan/chitin deacetylase (PgdA/CDA1 family)